MATAAILNAQSVPHKSVCPTCNPAAAAPPAPCDCPPIQLALGTKAALRRQLQSLVKRAEIPKDRLAHCILGMTAPTLWRHLKQGGIPQATRDQIQAIEYIKREGTKVYVVYDIGTLGKRWDGTLHRRKRAAQLAACATAV